MGMRVTGDEAVALFLRNVADRVPSNARKNMTRGADRIVRKAKLYAPVDEHNLEESIRQERTYTDSQGASVVSGGRVAIKISVGGTVNGVNVDEYAARIHENYDEEHPGKGTQAKRDANPGVHVGGKFLERALEEERHRLEVAIIEDTMRIIQ